MDAVMIGGCQCGAVRYALLAEPTETCLCHCRMCQKATGQPVAGFVQVPRAAFRWTRGDPPAFRSSSAAARHFCPQCGTPLTFAPTYADTISVTTGTLDDPALAPPRIHVGWEGRIAWMMPESLAALPHEDTVTDATPVAIADLVNFQHPDHETPEGWHPHVGPAA